MALRNVIHDDDERLAKKSREIEKIDERIHELIDDMIETLKEYDGVGLAAPQVGILKRLFIVDIGQGPQVFINPQISAQEGDTYETEGCLSVPGVWGKVHRPQKLVVRAQNRDGEEFEMDASDILARVICHENDHLDGIIFTQKVEEFIGE